MAAQTIRAALMMSFVASAIGCGDSATAPTAPTSTTAPGVTSTVGAGPTMAAPAGATITWKVPAAWPAAENPSRMRIATHKIPAAEGDTEGAELSISQAGGDVASNIARWKGQFDGASEPVQSDRSTADLKITVVAIEGTFKGGGMPGGPAAEPKPDQMMLGAIVEGTGAPYFFKLTGPKKTVEAARAGFDELVQSVTRSK
jgi:hypothetical protein